LTEEQQRLQALITAKAREVRQWQKVYYAMRGESPEKLKTLDTCRRLERELDKLLEEEARAQHQPSLF
jgi:hypothetical protein